MTIVSQTLVNTPQRQIHSTIRLGTDGENPIFKPNNIYNQRASHRQKQL